MSLNSILSSGLSSILTNSAIMRFTSDNIANVHTPGYVRRVAQQETQLSAGTLNGVKLGSVTRMVSDYLDREVLNTTGGAGHYDIQSSMMNQLNAALGQPGDGNSIGSKIDALYAALGQASLQPSALAPRLGVLGQFESLAGSISGLAGSIADLRADADQELATIASQANLLIQQIADLNSQIQRATIAGDTASGLLDQRDLIVQQLAEFVGVRTVNQADGRMFVFTPDGMQLIGDNYIELTYLPSGGPAFAPVTARTVNALTKQAVGFPQSFDQHVTSGQMRGLIELRDHLLVNVGMELGALSQSLSNTFNAVHNANATLPPPGAMTGRETGLLSTDTLNFTGATTIGIVDTAGVLQHKLAIDFTAGTLSVDGGAPGAIGTTIGNFTAALNGAFGPLGTASFANGVLSLSAAGGNGLVLADEPGIASSRGGAGFSHFFGLNDIFQAQSGAIANTGLTAADLAGFAPGGAISLLLKGPQGERVGETTVVLNGPTIGDMVNGLNTAFTGRATFALDASGALSVTPVAAFTDYELEVASDTSVRGSTGDSFSSLFGLGTGERMARAQGFRVSTDITLSPQRLGFAQPKLDSATALSATVLTPGDSRGLLALQDLINQRHPFASAGAIGARTGTFSDYTAAFYQDIASRGADIDRSRNTENTKLNIAKQAQSEKEGVNLDEELTKMMVLQQAYNAGARLIEVAQQLYDELLNAVRR